MMRKLVLGAFAAALIAGPAAAADQSYNKSPYDRGYEKRSGTWTGAQIGVLYGYSWMKDYNNTLRLEADGDGDVFGVYAAYNHQFDRFVGGAEVTYTRWENMFTDGSGVEVGDIFAAKLRGGIAHDRFLVYATAGVAHGTTNLAGNDWGTVIGAGLDVQLTHYLVAGLQYNYYRFVDFNETTIDADLNEVAVRIGYKF